MVDQSLHGQPLSAVSCASSQLCVATNDHGEILSSTDPTSADARWTATAPLRHGVSFALVSCPTTTLCVAVNHAPRALWVAVSTRPTGRARAWKVVHLTSARFDRAVSVDGTPTSNGGITQAVSCASASLCAIDTTVGVYVSDDPSGGAATWKLALALNQGTVSDATDTEHPKSGDIACPTVTLCVDVDGGFTPSDGQIESSTDPAAGSRSTWTRTRSFHGPATPAYQSFASVSCPTARLCVAVNAAGVVVTSTNPGAAKPVWTYRGDLPGSDADATDPLVGALSCTADGACVMVSSAGSRQPGAALVTTDATGPAADWTTVHGIGPSDLNDISCVAAAGPCVGVSQAGQAVTAPAPAEESSDWSVSPVINGVLEPVLLTGIACPSVSLCVATDLRGNVLSTVDPTSPHAAWQKVAADPGAELRSVSCPSVTFCTAVGTDGALVTSTDPTGPAAAWQPVTLTLTHPSDLGGLAPDRFASVACASAQDCIAPDYASDDIAASTDPAGGAGAWSAPYAGEPGYDAFEGASCPAVSACVAVGDNGDIFTQSNGQTESVLAPSPVQGLSDMFSVACPTESFCAAAGVSDVFTGSPLASAWTTADVEPDAEGAIEGIACASTQLCVVVDGAGRALVSSDPSGPASSWQTTELLPNAKVGLGLEGVACASASLCIAIGLGDVVVGS